MHHCRQMGAVAPCPFLLLVKSLMFSSESGVVLVSRLNYRVLWELAWVTASAGRVAELRMLGKTALTKLAETGLCVCSCILFIFLGYHQMQATRLMPFS